MAYVAQHTFHHFEKHLESTPTQYIIRRLAGNDDKERVEFKVDALSVDEEANKPDDWDSVSVLEQTHNEHYQATK